MAVTFRLEYVLLCPCGMTQGGIVGGVVVFGISARVSVAKRRAADIGLSWLIGIVDILGAMAAGPLTKSTSPSTAIAATAQAWTACSMLVWNADLVRASERYPGLIAGRPKRGGDVIRQGRRVVKKDARRDPVDINAMSQARALIPPEAPGPGPDHTRWPPRLRLGLGSGHPDPAGHYQSCPPTPSMPWPTLASGALPRPSLPRRPRARSTRWAGARHRRGGGPGPAHRGLQTVRHQQAPGHGPWPVHQQGHPRCPRGQYRPGATGPTRHRVRFSLAAPGT